MIDRNPIEIIDRVTKKLCRTATALRSAISTAVPFLRLNNCSPGVVTLRQIAGDDDYRSYVAHQSAKTSDPQKIEKWMGAEWEVKLNGFRELFSRYPATVLIPGGRALCAGARTGQEVVALNEMSMNSVGVDLVAFPPHVIQGDMHEIPFGDETFDFVFCNVIDHTPLPHVAIAEFERVAKPNGHILLFLQVGVLGDAFTENIIYSARKAERMFAKSTIVQSKRDRTTFDGMNYSILARKI